MNRIVVVVNAKARPKQSTRFTGRGCYTPKVIQEYQNLIRNEFLKETDNETLVFGNKPLYVNINIEFAIPKSYTKKRRQEIQDNNNIYTNKPDVDNLSKAILDALNGVAWEDDKQVCSLFIQKQYGEHNRIYISIREI